MSGAAAVAAGGFPTPSRAAPSPGGWTRSTTQNGFPVIDPTKVDSYPVEGSGAVVALLPGTVATVLLHVARRFSYEIDPLGRGDVHGHRTGRYVKAPFESNQLSGTAIVIRAGRYPIGSAGNLFAAQLLVVRDILAECEGVVRWGGDDPYQPKEGHFQIDVAPGDPALKRVAAKIGGWRDRPGMGAGSPVDLAQPGRRSAARALERRQRPA
ncbi:hypothetical protein AB0J90_17875 [Micromonospora sp. NPDC049523]|uniref:hypothetical protein n=1 Tax=Micromonospora sp. NPDC049523 TaxID=3155921 RepID=UPI0034259780